MSESIKPYYFESLEKSDQYSALEAEFSVISPKLRENYRNLEKTVSQSFIDIYGKYINDKQKKYFSEIQTIFTDYKTANTFMDSWDSGKALVDADDAGIDGFIYQSYSIGEEEKNSTKIPGGQTVEHYWSGRFNIHPLGKDEIYEVDPKWLMTTNEFEDLTSSKSFDTIGPFIYTNGIGGAVLHEKVHGITDLNIPRPIQEAAAHYYQRELFKIRNWNCDLMSNMDLFADLYEQCINECGDDVHRLIFGNLQDGNTRNELLDTLKNKFNSDTIEQLSKQGDNKHSWIHWKKQPIESIESPKNS